MIKNRKVFVEMKPPMSVKHLLNREMDRKEFLRSIAAAVLMVAGGGILINMLSNALQPDNHKSRVGTSDFYGSSVYGGDRT